MQSTGREPSMEDILASIKKVIAEEKELRTSRPPPAEPDDEYSDDEDVLELNEPLAPAVDLGPPLIDEQAAGKSRQALEQLQTVAATVPAAAVRATRSRKSSARCCARCSSNGSTSICRRWSTSM